MKFDIRISEAPERELAKAFVALANDEPSLHIALSGGTTPRALYQLLAAEYRKDIPWHRITVFQVDERCVPPDDPQSNWRMIDEVLLSHVPVAAHRIEAERSDGADAYEQVLIDHAPIGVGALPELDVVFLGMGADGHTASLFPNTLAIEEKKRLVVVNEVGAIQSSRVTMTFPMLNHAKRRWMLVKGADKAKAFKRVRDGKLPAGQLTDAVWYIDGLVAGEEDPR